MAPEVATPRVMSETLAIFYAFGGLAGLLAIWGTSPDWPRTGVLLGLAVAALGCALVLSRWGSRWPRWFFHIPVGAATGLIALGAHLASDPVSAIVGAFLIVFVGVDAHFFFRRPLDLLHLGVAVGLTSLAVLARGDIAAPTVLAVDAVVIAMGVVTRRLVARASSASRDPLTGLVNRRGFDESLTELLARPGQLLSVALLDLDHFKEINDTLGHEAGDRVLCRVSDAWRRAVPRGAVLARHGGDEFALLLPDTRGPVALELVRRLCDLHPDVGLSCGVAQHIPGETGAQLMRRADHALYTAKDGGRGRAELARGTRRAGQPAG